MSTKVKRYGWKLNGDERQTIEFATRAIRDASRPEGDGWTKYTVTRTVRAKGRPIWWAIRQLQEGRAVRDADGDTWWPSDDEHPNRGLFSLLQSAGADGFDDTDGYARSWTLAGQP